MYFISTIVASYNLQNTTSAITTAINAYVKFFLLSLSLSAIIPRNNITAIIANIISIARLSSLKAQRRLYAAICTFLNAVSYLLTPVILKVLIVSLSRPFITAILIIISASIPAFSNLVTIVIHL